jgi:hypothetical protein
VTTLYALFNGEPGTGEYAIGAATYDGATWTEYASNPVLQKGSGWESGHVKDPMLLWDGSQYVCYYAGYNGSQYQIGRATATTYSGPWTKYASNPVLALGAGGAFDDNGLAFPTVLYEPDDVSKPWKMWYRADDGSNHLTIGYAHSTDGLAWTKVGKVLDVGTGGAWDDAWVQPCTVVKVGATYYLFTGGASSVTQPHFWQGGLVTFTDPEGTYTRDAGNPLLKARFNDSGTTLTPTADIALGATQVHLTDTSAFNIGEPVVLADDDTTAETFYVTALNSSTVLTLDHAVSTGTYTAAHGFVFRSFAWTSIIPRTVRATVSGYEAFAAVFQPVDDLLQPASYLWEGSFRLTAAALTGPWSYDYVAGRGLLFPFTSAAWHARSAENPSVISVSDAVITDGVGFWVDWANDGFSTGATVADDPGLLARGMPEGDGTAAYSDDITADLISISWHVGATSDLLGGSGADSLTAVLKNTAGKYNPDNASSVLAGLLRPNRKVWLGVNADGTLTGTGQTVYPLFAGRVREIAPIPAGGAQDAPTVEILCDGILADYARKSVHVADSTSRSQAAFRAAVLDAIDPDANVDLADEPDTLPLSSADSTSALTVLEDLNRANGSGHAITPAALSDWYTYTSHNRHYKLGAAPDWSIDAGAEHVTGIDGLRLNADTVINDQRATVDPVSISPALSVVWTYDKAPFTLNGNLVIWANFEDYVDRPEISVNVSSGAVTSTLTSFGHSAKLELYSAAAQVGTLEVIGHAIVRDSSVTVSTDYLPEAAPSQAAYGIRTGSALSGDLLGSQASAQGIVDHIVFRRALPAPAAGGDRDELAPVDVRGPGVRRHGRDRGAVRHDRAAVRCRRDRRPLRPRGLGHRRLVDVRLPAPGVLAPDADDVFHARYLNPQRPGHLGVLDELHDASHVQLRRGPDGSPGEHPRRRHRLPQGRRGGRDVLGLHRHAGRGDEHRRCDRPDDHVHSREPRCGRLVHVGLGRDRAGERDPRGLHHDHAHGEGPRPVRGQRHGLPLGEAVQGRDGVLGGVVPRDLRRHGRGRGVRLRRGGGGHGHHLEALSELDRGAQRLVHHPDGRPVRAGRIGDTDG